tara:strand:- start:158 stop:343 length:186 start_codon:yes stop_codon:yes gene_type:complete
MPQMQQTGSPIWDVASAANDANAALTIWDADSAAIAIGAALPSLQQSGVMLKSQQFTLARC